MRSVAVELGLAASAAGTAASLTQSVMDSFGCEVCLKRHREFETYLNILCLQ